MHLEPQPTVQPGGQVGVVGHEGLALALTNRSADSMIRGQLELERKTAPKSTAARIADTASRMEALLGPVKRTPAETA